ncbi:microsomal signal peptidase 12kDa subunit [Calycina marina]|uniref:Signal peptidase complex subunit 1 n=1 Tax=Calycina marina TaxID=1763456 RepID=A0A9P7ZCF4_9HELO|nr:microsomal signal peptidase 12kDa subunit [Calycina marina]
MADQLLENARDLFEGQIDFEGQRLAEFLATVLLSIVGVVSFLYGYFLQDIKLALLIGLGGTVLTFLLVVPPWPLFKAHPVKWLPAPEENKSSQGIVVDGMVIG